MTILYLDFETRSHCDLKKHGVYNYAQDATTDVLCMSYAFDDEDMVTWLPTQPFPKRVRDHTGLIYAHNAAFERLIFWYVLQINFKLEQFYCTATQARANCAPGSLEDVGRFAGASMKKDYRGAQLIRALCVPPFKEDAALMTEMVQYCEQDVRAMRAVSQSLRPLSDEELEDYHVNEKINDRGVLVDVPLASAAISYAATELEDIQSIVRTVTNGAITSVRSPKMREWVKERLSPEQLKLMEVEDGKYSIDKRVRANLLAVEDLPPDVAEVIQCADDLWASSVAKFSRLKDLADVEDSRVRGAFVFAGGSATGRASSYGAQVHNFTRKCAKDPESVRASMVLGHPIVPQFGRRVTDVLKGMLRPAIIPSKGKSLVVADWAQIEARMTPWLSGRGDDVLDVFRSGRDIYIREAAAMYKIPEDQVTPDQRQIGKVAILACGFGGGIGAFSAMGRAYGLTMTESDAQRTVDAWRRANQWAVRYWQELETGYMIAMRNKGKEIVAGRVTYMFDGQHLWYALPSGRILCYPYAKLEEDGISYAKAAWKPAVDAREWPRARLWRGLACENITQAAANDVLRRSLRLCDEAGLQVILHCHDEIVLECDENKIESSTATLTDIMCTSPEWANGLPLGVEIKAMARYGK
jgi:DNA polymerase